jgi:outer membrane protein OmpA-like peptidoglycan-associated protein
MKTKIVIVFFYISSLFSCQSIFGQKDLVEAIYFKSNSYAIDKKYNKILNEIAIKCASDNFGYLKVFGYSDTTGSEDYNDKLSEKRTEAVYNYLASHAKLDTTKVYYTWLGESEDGYDLHFPPAHIQQRCVDIWVIFYNKH